METLYKPEGVEERWEQIWEQEGLYNADPDPTRASFVIAHPPPNVTGDLHMGHALQLSLADTIVPDFPLTNKSFNLSYAGNDL